MEKPAKNPIENEEKTLKKKILPFMLALCLAFSPVAAPSLPAKAQATYSTANALAYASAHWNDGVGLCAEFASKVLQAGGINMKTQARVINCLKSAEKATGLTRTPLKLTPLKDYKGTTSEMATYELDGDILAPGDLVVQWCHTHNIGPHVMICAGYDSQGYAVYYAHNGAMNQQRFQLGDSLAYEHTHNCDMGAYVLRVSTLDPTFTGNTYTPPTEAVPETRHTHNYNSVGRCIDCGQEYSLHYSTTSKKGTVRRSTPLKVRPYTDADSVRTVSPGEIIEINAKGENAFGDSWYRVSGNYWLPEDLVVLSNTETTAAAATTAAKTEWNDMVDQIFKDAQKIAEQSASDFNVAPPAMPESDAMHTMPDFANEPESIEAGVPDSCITVGPAKQVTDTTAHIDGECSYSSGNKPSSVGINLGTSKSSMKTVDSDVINHNKNPFDIWYDLNDLTPGTTYYYSLYAIINGDKTETPVKSFTTKAAANTTTNQTNITINATKATKVKKTSVQVNGNCKYSGTRPSSVGLYFGTSKDSMTKKDSDTINHKKNPFDIWYNLSNLSAGTTYYYQLYAIVDGKEYKSNILSFTTAK